MADAKPDVMTHEPLPYRVVVREKIAGDDDAVPIAHEWRGPAYSVLEAMLQGMIAAGGRGDVDESRFTVEEIGPDMPAYLAMIAERMGSATAALALRRELAVAVEQAARTWWGSGARAREFVGWEFELLITGLKAAVLSGKAE